MCIFFPLESTVGVSFKKLISLAVTLSKSALNLNVFKESRSHNLELKSSLFQAQYFVNNKSNLSYTFLFQFCLLSRVILCFSTKDMPSLGILAFIRGSDLIVLMAPYLTLHNHLISEENLAVNAFHYILLLLQILAFINKDNRVHIYTYNILDMIFVLTHQESLHISSYIVCITNHFFPENLFNKACYYI